MVRTVLDHQQAIYECCEEIPESPSTNFVEIQKASGVCRTLKDPNFSFWLNFFVEIFPHVDVIFNEMQSKDQTDRVQKSIATFKGIIQSVRNSRVTEHTSQSIKAQTKEVCDNFISDIETRYQFTGHLISA